MGVAAGAGISMPKANRGRPVTGRRAARTPVWVATTYFAEGLPYMVVRFLAGVYLTDIGVKERYLGMLNFLGLPWNAKFLWAPAVDLTGTKRAWLLGSQFLIVVSVALMAVLTTFVPPDISVSGLDAATPGAWALRALLALLVGLAFLSATHDIAIDGYYMEAIPDPDEQAAYTGLRVLAYRLAVIFAKSVLVALASWATWQWGFLGGAAAMGLLLVFHSRYLPVTEVPRTGPRRPMGELLADFGRAFGSYLEQPKVAIIVAFVVTYKLADEVLFSMNTPFLLREMGVTKDHLAWIAGVLGSSATIGGSLVSAWAVKRWGFRRSVWPLTLGMNLNIWAYVWLAWARPDASQAGGLAVVAMVHAYEQFAAGLGNAVLIVYIMRTCRPEFKAAHYAIASALASLGGTLVGGISGWLVEMIGYVNLYLLAFVASFPSMVLLCFLPMEEPRRAKP